jgi:hypothetical protein
MRFVVVRKEKVTFMFANRNTAHKSPNAGTEKESTGWEHKRVMLGARFMTEESRDEHRGQMIAGSRQVAVFHCEHKPEVGIRVIALVDQLGRVEGLVAGHTLMGFNIKLAFTPTKATRFAKDIGIIADKTANGTKFMDRFDRVVVDRTIHVKFGTRNAEHARMMNLSRSGAAISGIEDAYIGEPVSIGATQMKGKIVRLFDVDKVGVEFVRLLPLEVVYEGAAF